MFLLYNFLPPESATATAIRNSVDDSGGVISEYVESEPSSQSWSHAAMLLASVIDELRWFRYEFRSANSSDPGKLPTQIERPGVKRTKRKPLTMEQRRMLDPRLRGEHNDG